MAEARDDSNTSETNDEGLAAGWGTSPTQLLETEESSWQPEAPRPLAPNFDKTPSPPLNWKASSSWEAWATDRDATKQQHLEAALHEAYAAAAPTSGEPEPEAALHGNKSPGEIKAKVGPLHPNAATHDKRPSKHAWNTSGDTPLQPKGSKLLRDHT